MTTFHPPAPSRRGAPLRALGVALIGFTYLQIRILRKVEFRRASTN